MKFTTPARMRLMKRSQCLASSLTRPAERPYLVALAAAMAASKVGTRRTCRKGANISSSSTATPVTSMIAGLTKAPGRLSTGPDARMTLAPALMRCCKAARALLAAFSEIRGPA
ncbi:hypothetical protein D3C85_1420120 [compost metagenome]